MDIGLVGLGKMGYALGENMRDHGHRVVAFSRDAEKAAMLRADGFEATTRADELVGRLSGRRLIWLMVPAGDAVDRMVDLFDPLLAPGDILADGGNSHYRDSVRRSSALGSRGIGYADIGISGGPVGARSGACMMIGASEEVSAFLEPLVKELCREKGFMRVGECGAGHYVKMVHNGIEYGMMQAIAEGFELLHRGPYAIDSGAVASLWNSGSVIRGWLIELTARLLEADPSLEGIGGKVGSSGTGLWAVEEALSLRVPLPVITQSLYVRYRSGQENTYPDRLVAGLRREFGGHEVQKPGDYKA